MDSMQAAVMGSVNRGKPLMVFDWDKAAQLIKESGATEAAAGLRGDWEWTGGDIWRDGAPFTDSYTFLASTWAEPELELDDYTRRPCWRYQDQTPGWNAHTCWPDSALAILKES